MADVSAASGPSWEIAAKVVDEDLRAQAAAVRSVACANDLVVTGSSQPVVKVWQVAEAALTPIHRFDLVDTHGAVGCSCVEVAGGSGEGQLAAVCYDDGGIGLFDLRQRASAGELPATAEKTFKCKFLPGGRRLVSGGPSGSVCFWDLRHGKLETEVTARSARIKGEEDVKRQRTGAKDQGDDASRKASPIFSLAVSSDSSLLACGRGNGNVSVMRVESQEWTSDVNVHHGSNPKHVPVRGLCFDAQSRLLMSGGDDNHVVLFDANMWARRARNDGRKNAQLERFSAHRGWVTSVCVCPDPLNRVSLSTSWDGTVKLWDYSSHDLLHTYKDHTESVFDAAFAPVDGKFFATVGVDAQICLYTAKHRTAGSAPRAAKADLKEEIKVKMKDGDGA